MLSMLVTLMSMLLLNMTDIIDGDDGVAGNSVGEADAYSLRFMIEVLVTKFFKELFRLADLGWCC